MPRKNIINSSTLARLQIVFVLVVLPIIAAGLLFQHVGQRMLDEQLMSILSQQLQFNINEIDDQMRGVKEDALNLLTSVKTRRLTGMPYLLKGYAFADAVNDLESSLTRMRHTYPVVAHLELYMPKLSRALNTDNLAPNYAPMDSARFAQMFSDGTDIGTATVFQGERLYSIIIDPVSVPSVVVVNPRTLLYIEYSLQNISGQLESMLPEHNPSFALFTRSGDLILSNGQDPALIEAIASWSRQRPFARMPSKADMQFQGTARIGGRNLFLLSKDSDAQNIRYLFYLPKDEAFSNITLFRQAMVVLISIFILALLLYGFYSYKNIHKPIQALTGAFERLKRGDMDFQIDPMAQRKAPNEFIYLTERFNDTLSQLKSNVEQVLHMQTLTQRAQLKQLQAQINPHFLYNSFYLLSGMLQMEDVENGRRLAELLGHYFKYIVRNGKDDVSLSVETEHARAYAELQKMRLGRRLTLDFPPYPQTYPNPDVPKLILQPILENAFVHALEMKETPGTLELRYDMDGQFIRISVENDGVAGAGELALRLTEQFRVCGRSAETSGLLNVHERLVMVQGRGLVVTSPSNGWLRVVVSIRKGT